MGIETKQQRKEKIEYAFVSCELEGCIIPDCHREIGQRYIDGKISIGTAVQEMLQAADEITKAECCSM